MIGGVSGIGGQIEFNPTDLTDLPEATVKARFQVAALKAEQDILRMQGDEMARLIEPNKGTVLDARA
jgi:hypothetical protein